MQALANGALIRALRVRAGMKQAHLAEIMCVSQATVSRWERGALPLSEAQIAAIERSLARACGPSRDSALKRLIESSTLRVHLVCDRTHRLLAASAPRAAEWRADLAGLIGRALLAFASPEILKAEASLEGLGWYERSFGALTVDTGPNADASVPIPAGRFTWERFSLADGTPARLVTTLA
ncbi:MAG: helix-turn-helix transcriptional regulator [Alphaproteobacteria bacterium]